VDLKRVVCDLAGGALGEQLGHRHLADRVLAVVEEAQRMVGQRP
jgi:hypothetical protein